MLQELKETLKPKKIITVVVLCVATGIIGSFWEWATNGNMAWTATLTAACMAVIAFVVFIKIGFVTISRD